MRRDEFIRNLAALVAAAAALTDIVVRATKSRSWQEALKKNGWTPALQTGREFEDFVEYEFASLNAIMSLSGMV